MKWNKGTDFMDNTPRYTIPHHCPETSIADITIVIYQEKVVIIKGFPKEKRYFGQVRHCPSETMDTIGGFKLLKEAKMETEKLFREYRVIFNR